MQRQRGELVPIGDALSGMSGPVKLIRDATPQALHHFTRADQVNQLVTASEADVWYGRKAPFRPVHTARNYRALGNLKNWRIRSRFQFFSSSYLTEPRSSLGLVTRCQPVTSPRNTGSRIGTVKIPRTHPSRSHRTLDIRMSVRRQCQSMGN